MNRRKFLTTSLAICLSSAAAGSSKNGNIILGGGQYTLADSEEIHYVLSIIDLKSNDRQLTPMEFLAHGIHRNPTRKTQLAIFEKKGPHACEYDLLTQRVTRKIPKVKNQHFYGHGAYSIDGTLLFSTETRMDSLAGVIGVRGSRELDYLGEFPSYGLEPHECKLIDAGKTMVVTNGGGDKNGAAPSVAYIDVNSQQLIEKITLSRAELNAGHLAISPNGDLVVVSAPRLGLATDSLGGVSIRPVKQTLVSLSDPHDVTRRMQGEALSVAIHAGKGIVAVTHPDGGMVTFWSIAGRQLLKVLNMPHPRGIELTVDQQFFLVSYGANTTLARVSVDTLVMDTSESLSETYITGSHIYNWSRDMDELYFPA